MAAATVRLSKQSVTVMGRRYRRSCAVPANQPWSGVAALVAAMGSKLRG